jgi:hypothetical protein
MYVTSKKWPGPNPFIPDQMLLWDKKTFPWDKLILPWDKLICPGANTIVPGSPTKIPPIRANGYEKRLALIGVKIWVT